MTGRRVIDVRKGIMLLGYAAIAAASFDPARAQDPVEKTEAKAKAAASPDVKEAPQASEFLVIPLRVHVLRSKELPDVDCALTDDDIRRIIGKVNKVWSVAGIHFGLESILRETAAAEERFKTLAPKEGMPPLNLYRILAPLETRSFDGQSVYYIHKFAVNGVFLGNRMSFVQETAKLRPVPGGIDEPLPRVTAHELGHSLTLPHRQDRLNLLASGTTGTLLNRDEVKQARDAARKMPGVLPLDEIKKRLQSADEPSADRLKTWAEGVEKLASPKK